MCTMAVSVRLSRVEPAGWLVRLAGWCCCVLQLSMAKHQSRTQQYPARQSLLRLPLPANN
jgi:hypothetical protein